MYRTIALWVFGLFASGMIGGMIANHFGFGQNDTAIFGGLACMAAFACVRLWATEKRKGQ